MPLASALRSPVRHRLDNSMLRRKRARFEGPEDSAIQPIESLEMTLNSVIQDGDINFPGDLALVTDAATSSGMVLDEGTSNSIPSQTTSQPLTEIQHAAHLNRLALQKQMTEGKGTEDAYPRHVKNYETFWAQDQDRRARENPNHIRISAHPIVGEKVAIFLEHERTRNKVAIFCSCSYIHNLIMYSQRNNRGHEIGGSSVGKESIKQSINALQRYMKEHQHLPEYQDCPETWMPLRDQEWVKIYENAAYANEPTRIKNAHTMKSKGTSAGKLLNFYFSAMELK